MFKQATLGLSLTAAALAASSCSSGSGGGSTAVSGLSAPDQLEIVQAVEGTSSTGSVGPAATDPGFEPTASYYTDPQNVYVYDPAVEPLQLVNRILCFMGQTGADTIVNEDPYIAQVDVAACEDGGNQSSAGSSSGQSSTGGGEEIQLWTVSSQRASNSAPHDVHIWVPDEEGGPERIFVDLEITESPSTENPFGQFTMNYARSDTFANIATPEMIGSLRSVETPIIGDVGFTFFEDFGDITAVPAPGDFASRVQVNVEMNEDQTGGWAHILSSERYDFGGGDSGLLTEEFDVAFDETHFLRATDGGGDVAYERDTFDENVWSYNLYHATGPNAGEQVELQGGFGFETGQGVYGWASYYGLWVPDGTTLTNGETVTADTYSDDEEEILFEQETYTVFQAPGRLIRYGKESLDLTEIAGMTFEWWTWDSVQQEQVIYLVQYFLASDTWRQIATVDINTYEHTLLSPTVVIDTSAEGVLNMWSDALGGNVVFIDGEDEMTYYERAFVDGSDDEFDGSTVLTLYGFTQGLRSEITTSEAENGNIYLMDAPDVMTPQQFEFRETDLTLWHDSDGMGTFTQVGLGAGQAPTSGPNTWGMNSGPLVTPATAATLVSIYDVWNADEFYVYETGHNPWNQYTGLKDSEGEFVEFDAPMNFSYVHATADDRNDDATYDGQTFLLQYGGPGNLYGFPYLGVDLNGDTEFDRYYPQINLQDGTVLTDGQGTTYVVKAVEIEQALAQDGAYAGTLTTAQAGTLVLPDLSSYVTPTIGDEPVVTDAPRVIDGEPVGLENEL